MTNPVDIRPDHLRIVHDVLHDHLPAGIKVWVFGSRAQWSAWEGSDLDLALEGETKLDRKVMATLTDALEDSDLPYTVDVVDLNRISKQFRQIVDSHKVSLSLGTGRDEVIEWTTMPFSEAVTVNPPVRLERGSCYPFVDMAAVNPGSRWSYAVAQRKFSGGGSRFQHGDTLMARITPCLENGKVARYRSIDDVSVAHGSTEFIVIRGRLDVTDDDFAYYLTRSPEVRSHAISQMTGTSGRQRVPVSALDHVDVPVPPLPEQRAIAHVLGTLDDKIELNRRMNETLEEMARALFKSWFVDFDPVRAKIDGRWREGESLPGLPSDLYHLLPERMVPSELGEIPEGWGVKTIGDLATVVGGSTPSTKTVEYWAGGTHCWVTPKDLSTLSVPVLLDTERKITDKGLKRIGSGLQPPGTVLLSSRAPIGYLAINEISVAINQGFIAIQPKHEIPNLFLLYWCDSFLAEILNYANGSTFLEVSKSSFRGIPIVEPSEPVLACYRQLASILYQKLVANERSTRALSEQRDALLPRLVSGRVKVPCMTEVQFD